MATDPKLPEQLEIFKIPHTVPQAPPLNVAGAAYNQGRRADRSGFHPMHPFQCAGSSNPTETPPKLRLRPRSLLPYGMEELSDRVRPCPDAPSSGLGRQQFGITPPGEVKLRLCPTTAGSSREAYSALVETRGMKSRPVAMAFLESSNSEKDEVRDDVGTVPSNAQKVEPEHFIKHMLSTLSALEHRLASAQDPVK